jgi:hypothetical protein
MKVWGNMILIIGGDYVKMVHHWGGGGVIQQ